MIRRAFAIIFLSATTIFAQEMAFVVSCRGTVKVKDAAGNEKDAVINMKLKEGDVISTGADGSANLMYFSGKEVILGSKSNHKLVKRTEPSVLTNLYKVMADMMTEKDSKDLVGATRAWASDSNRTLVPLYPAETKVMEKEPVFEWKDKRGTADHEYVVVLRGQVTDFEYEIPVQGVTRVSYPSTAPALINQERYTWSVKDAGSSYVSPIVNFSLIAEEDRTELQQELTDILAICNSDNTNAQWHLLSSAVYRRFSLMKQAENAVQLLVANKPDMAQAHVMLATLYKEMGRFEDAKAQEEIIRELTLKK